MTAMEALAPSAALSVATNSEPIITMDKVSKWFGPVRVLTDVSLRVRPGERIVICGPSGSGKSTTIRCINRLEPYQKGRIVVDGIDLDASSRNVNAVRRRSAWCSSSSTCFRTSPCWRTACWRR